MAGKRPVFTENFSSNLLTIHSFLGLEGDSAYQHLLDRLFEDIVPTICQFPKSGPSFLAHTIRSSDAQRLIKKLQARLKRADDLREFILDDYLVLYLIRRDRVVFLSIKHHRQLSFDLKGFLPER